MNDGAVNIGIDLGGTHIKGVLVDIDGAILNTRTANTSLEQPGSGSGWITAIKNMIAELRALHGAIGGVGISAPGLCSADNRSILLMPGRLAGLENLDWSNALNEPQVTVLNDAHAAMIAESHAGAAKGYRHALMLTLGTGVGGALLIDGKLHQGFLQRAGHIGHMSLNTNAATGILDIPGTLEEAFGNATISGRSHGRFESTKALVTAYQSGDHLATFLWLDSVHKLSLALASLVNIVSPEVIVLGGGISRAQNALLDPLNEFMDLYEWKPGQVKTPIVLAAFDEYSGAAGAGFYAFHNKKNQIVT